MAANNAKDQLLSELREIAITGNGYSGAEYEKIEEKLYVPVQKEEWGEVEETLKEISENHGFNLDRQLEYLDEIRNPDKLQGVDEEKVDQDASSREKLLIQHQVEQSDNEELLANVEESIGIKQIFDLQENIYEQTQKKCFIISRQRKWDGRISVELESTKKKFELMAVYEGKEGGRKYKHFGQASSGYKGLNKVDDFTESFYQYKFISNDQEYLVLSREKLDTVRCKLYGTHVSLNDYKTVGENRKLPVNQDIIFVHSVDPAIETMTDDEIEDYRKDVDHEYLAKKLLGDWRQPKWFEKFLLADIFVNDENGHPSHLIEVGPPGTGKSNMVQAGLIALDEAQKEPFTGSGSTIKGLVPSFKERPPEEGYLLKTQRMAGVDEKMDLLSNTVQQSNSSVSDVFRPLLNLLTHDVRTFESGNGSIKGQMTSTMWSVGNLNAYGIANMKDLATDIDDAYLSRCVVYNQTDKHVQFINDRKAKVKQKMQDEGLTEDDLYPERDDDFISLVDTMQERKYATVNFKEVAKIRKELRDLVPGYMIEKYRARYEHHMTNVVSGLAKYGYLVEDRDSVEAQPEDYEAMKNIFEIIISSWGDIDTSKLSKSAAKQALTPAQRQVFNVINEQPGITTPQLADKVDVDSLSWCLKELEDTDLVVAVEDEDGERLMHPWWSDEAEKAFEMKNSGDEYE